MLLNKSDTIPFGKLIHILKSSGYDVSVEQILEIQSIFLSCSLNEIKTAELKYVIAPIVAKNEDDQQKIYSIVDAYVQDAIGFPVTAPKRLLKPQKDDTLKIFLSIFIPLLLILVFAFLFKKKEKNAFEELSIVPVGKTTEKKVEPIKKNPGAFTKPSTPKVEDKPIVKDGFGFSVKALEPIRPIVTAKNINAQLCVIFGILIGVILSFVIFSTKEKETEVISKHKAVAENNNDEIQVALSDSSQKNGFGNSPPTKLQFDDNNFLIVEDKYSLAIKKNLKKYGAGSLQLLDINKSIFNTVQNAGFYSLAFSYHKQPRKFLVLVDETHFNSHLVSLFNYFIDKLSSANVFIEKYKYHRSISSLRNERGNEVSLATLAASRSEFQLIVFGDCEKLFDQLNPLSTKFSHLFNTWESKSIITALPIVDWSDNERMAQLKKFNLVPAEIAAIELLTQTLTGSGLLTKNKLWKRMDNPYPVSNMDFETVDGLRNYLNDETLFQLVCSLAVYPRLDWPITLALFHAITKSEGSILSTENDYDTLLKISRIPWLNAEQIEEPLRLSLLENIEPATEAIAREILLLMLQKASVSTPKSSLDYQELETQILLNKFLLFAHNGKKFRNYSATKKQILSEWGNVTDLLLKSHIQSGNSKLMPKNKTGGYLNIEEFLVKEEEKEVRKITFLRCLTILIPPLLIYLSLIVFRPGFAYPAGSEQYGKHQVTIVTKKDKCLVGVDTISIQNQMAFVSTTLDTTYLLEVGYNDPIRISYQFMNLERKVTIDGKHAFYVIGLTECK